MNVTINGKIHQLDGDHLTVDGLLDTLDLPRRQGVAVAVNSNVIARSDWQDHRVADGDNVEVIHAAQGG